MVNAGELKLLRAESKCVDSHGPGQAVKLCLVGLGLLLPCSLALALSLSLSLSLFLSLSLSLFVLHLVCGSGAACGSKNIQPAGARTDTSHAADPRSRRSTNRSSEPLSASVCHSSFEAMAEAAADLVPRKRSDFGTSLYPESDRTSLQGLGNGLTLD